jgi:GNAT superfamily N-acetyltransferase
MALAVRDAVASEAAAIRDVAAAAWRDTYGTQLTGSTIESFIESSYSIERLGRRIERHVFLVAVDEAEIVAFAEGDPGPDRLTLVSIYARPEHRGRGAGTLLLGELLTRHPDLPIAADVLEGNRLGESFYERRGFVPRERIEVDLFSQPVVERRWWLER